MLPFLGTQRSILFPLFTIDSDSFSPNAELVVLVCSQCSTARHSACLWRCISHLVFGIQPVDSLMSSWHAECHQTLAAKTKVVWPRPVRRRAVHHVRGAERAHRCEWVLWWVPCICEIECDRACMHMLKEESHRIKPEWWSPSLAVSLATRWSSSLTCCPNNRGLLQLWDWCECVNGRVPVLVLMRSERRCSEGDVSTQLYMFVITSLISFRHLKRSTFSHLCVCMTPRAYVWICLHLAVGEPGGRGSGTSRGHQRGAERTLGPKQRLLMSGLAAPEPGPDESQCHQWDHEHREALHQTP